MMIPNVPKAFKPGALARVCERVINDGTKEIRLTTIPTWLQPDDDIPVKWRFRRDIKMTQELAGRRGNNLNVGQTALITSVIRTQWNWIMLLPESGQYCWVYNPHGLELLSPAGDSVGGQ